MLLAGLLTSLFLLSIAIILLIMLKFTRNNRLKNRQAILESFQSRPMVAASQKVNELSRRFINLLGKQSRRNLLLEVAYEFKGVFNLGRFAIFELDKDRFAPIMSFGLNLKNLKPFKASLPETDNHRNPAVNRIRGALGDKIAYGQSEAATLAGLAGYPEDTSSLFVYFYQDDSFGLLFLGEDPDRELAGYCLNDEFNKYVWPELYGLYKHCQNLYKVQAKIRENGYPESRSRRSVDQIEKKTRADILNPQSMLNIANKLYSSSNENRLLEIYQDYLMTALSITKIAIYTPELDNTLSLAYSGGYSNIPIEAKELSTDSQIYKLIMNRKSDAVITLGAGDNRPENATNAFVHDQKFTLMGRIYANDILKAVILIGEHVGGKAYTEEEVIFLAGITNIASLAMENIARYGMVEKLSYTDSMTELYNYRYFYKRLSEEIYRAKRFNRELALVIFDIDNFKYINDSFGHQAGDEILKKLSKLIVSSVRAIDVVSRYGGEEFCVIMPDTGNASCSIFIERLRKMIAEHKFNNDHTEDTYSISVSCGGAIYPADAQSVDRLIYCADMALLEAKSGGRNRALMCEPGMLERNTSNNKINIPENRPEKNNEV